MDKQEALSLADAKYRVMSKLEDEIIALCNEHGISYSFCLLNGADNQYVGKGAPGILCGECQGDWKGNDKYPEDCAECDVGYTKSSWPGWQQSFC